MAKLMLELDALKVESFGTSPAAAAVRGTVYGQQAATGTKPSCVSCYAPTDPCICDPIRDLTDVC
jgi:hypothetical protein